MSFRLLVFFCLSDLARLGVCLLVYLSALVFGCLQSACSFVFFSALVFWVYFCLFVCLFACLFVCSFLCLQFPLQGRGKTKVIKHPAKIFTWGGRNVSNTAVKILYPVSIIFRDVTVSQGAKSITPVCLPTTTRGVKATIAGWGYTQRVRGETVKKLRSI